MMIRLGTPIESVSPWRGGVPKCSRRSAGQLPGFRSLNEEFGWAPKGNDCGQRLEDRQHERPPAAVAPSLGPVNVT